MLFEYQSHSRNCLYGDWYRDYAWKVFSKNCSRGRRASGGWDHKKVDHKNLFEAALRKQIKKIYCRCLLERFSSNREIVGARQAAVFWLNDQRDFDVVFDWISFVSVGFTQLGIVCYSKKCWSFQVGQLLNFRELIVKKRVTKIIRGFFESNPQKCLRFWNYFFLLKSGSESQGECLGMNPADFLLRSANFRTRLTSTTCWQI